MGVLMLTCMAGQGILPDPSLWLGVRYVLLPVYPAALWTMETPPPPPIVNRRTENLKTLLSFMLRGQ